MTLSSCSVFFSFFFNDTATTEIYTLSLHDALPIFLEVGDAGVAPLPLDGVVGMGARLGEEPTDPDADLLRRHCHGARSLLRRAPDQPSTAWNCVLASPNKPQYLVVGPPAYARCGVNY